MSVAEQMPFGVNGRCHGSEGEWLRVLPDLVAPVFYKTGDGLAAQIFDADLDGETVLDLARIEILWDVALP